jgi:hypothetical protein
MEDKIYEFKTNIYFNDKFYSMEDNKITEWNVVGISFYNYTRDGYHNLNNKPDVEYTLERYDKDAKFITSYAHQQNINKRFFYNKDSLVQYLLENQS